MTTPDGPVAVEVSVADDPQRKLRTIRTTSERLAPLRVLSIQDVRSYQRVGEIEVVPIQEFLLDVESFITGARP